MGGSGFVRDTEAFGRRIDHLLHAPLVVSRGHLLKFVCAHVALLWWLVWFGMLEFGRVGDGNGIGFGFLLCMCLVFVSLAGPFLNNISMFAAGPTVRQLAGLSCDASRRTAYQMNAGGGVRRWLGHARGNGAFDRGVWREVGVRCVWLRSLCFGVGVLGEI